MATQAEIRAEFEQRGLVPAPGDIERITRQVNSGERTMSSVESGLNWSRNQLLATGSEPGGKQLDPTMIDRDTNFLVPGPDGEPRQTTVTDGTTPDGSAAPNPSQPAPGVPDVQQRDWREDAQAMYPWLTPGLLDTFANEWADTGNANLALAYVRQSGEYKQVFPGIKRDDGSLRMSESEYFSNREGVAEAAAEFGFDPQKYRNQFGQMIQQGIDAREFAQAAQQAVQRFVEPGTEDTRLAQEYLDNFASVGSAQEALEQVRDSDTYEQVFAGNRRDDGSIRMEEPEYFAYQRGWRRLFVSRGLNPEPFESHGKLVEAVEGEVSIQELDGRMQAVEQGVLANSQSVREYFSNTYGEQAADFLSQMDEGELRGSALAMALDPDVGNDLLNRRITASQIGGEAAVQGFARSIDRAEELARAGITQKQARSLYSRAGQSLRGLSATTQRFGRGRTTVGDFEGAMALEDAEEQRRLDLSLRQEQSSFGQRRDLRRERDGFGLAGLNQR